MKGHSDGYSTARNHMRMNLLKHCRSQVKEVRRDMLSWSVKTSVMKPQRLPAAAGSCVILLFVCSDTLTQRLTLPPSSHPLCSPHMSHSCQCNVNASLSHQVPRSWSPSPSKVPWSSRCTRFRQWSVSSVVEPRSVKPDRALQAAARLLFVLPVAQLSTVASVV